jgi:hypothetical protein
VNFCFLSLRAASRTPPSPWDTRSRLCVRYVRVSSVFPLVGQLPSIPSAEDCSPLFGHFAGTTCPSDSPLTYMPVLQLVAFSGRSGVLLPDASGVSRFSRMEFSGMPGVWGLRGARGSLASNAIPRCGLPPCGTTSAPRTSGISQLNTLPACAPANASPATSR